ncbi:hypothetical protein Tco_1572908, partial [Tanacetum coccineum]
AQAVNTARPKAVNTVRPKAINTARPNSAVVNTIWANQANAIKASACWVWRPTKLDSASITLKKHNYIDARGRSKSISKSLIEDMSPLVEESEEEKSLDTKIAQSSGSPVKVGDEAVHKELGDRIERAATTASSLEAGQGSGTMHKIPTRPHDSPLPRVHTLGSDEGKMEYDFDVSTAEGFTTASVPITTVSATPEVSTAAANLVYIRRSAKNRKDKGKAIMKKDESV